MSDRSNIDSPDWIRSIFRHEIQSDGSAMSPRPKLNFSSDFEVVDSQSGDCTNVGLNLPIGGRSIRTTFLTTAATGSHTFLTASQAARIYMCGGGGGGGGVDGVASSLGASGGGGAGAYRILQYNLNGQTGSTYGVGDGGVAGSTSTLNLNGGTGGLTWWYTNSATVRTVAGGIGGAGMTSSLGSQQAEGGDATAAPSTAESIFAVQGAGGGNAFILGLGNISGSTISIAQAGHGGPGPLGGMSRKNVSSGDGVNGNRGGGGSGARSTTSADRAGGTGGVGFIIVEEFAGVFE